MAVGDRPVWSAAPRDRVLSRKRCDAAGRSPTATRGRDKFTIGGVTPPREFVLMDRAAIGLGSVFLHLKAEINWYNMFHDLIDGFDAAKLARRQKRALKDAGVPEAA